jgi:hypothetical protein
MIDNAWPAVAPILQRAYHEKQRAYVASVAGHYAGLRPWPLRRSSKRKPIPGVYALVDDGVG